MTLVVVGSVAFDSIITPIGRADEALGGSAVHFALSSAFQGPVKLVGVVGNDFPDERRELMSSRGIELEGLETVPDGKTFRWEGKYHEDMNSRETLSVELNVFEHFEPKLPKSYQETDFLFLANGAPMTQASVLEQVSGRPFVMADTMDLWIKIAHSELEDLLRRIDGLVLNDEEAALLTGIDNTIEAGRMIQRKYELRYVILKKGEHGCLIFHDGPDIALPAVPVSQVTDPTGAGDSFAGGVMSYLARAGNTDIDTMKCAVAWGTVMASFCCEDFGVNRMLELRLEDAEARYHHFRSMLTLTTA